MVRVQPLLERFRLAEKVGGSRPSFGDEAKVMIICAIQWIQVFILSVNPFLGLDHIAITNLIRIIGR